MSTFSEDMQTQPKAADYLPFSGKTIALGICGGIAAYRACDLIRELYRQGAARVLCLITRSAAEFITPATLHALSRHPVYAYDASVDESGLPIHIKLAQEADLLLVLPATVNTIGKMAQGLADDLLSTTFMTFTHKPVLLAPAMNTRMWEHPVFQDNLSRLLALPHVSMVSPTSGLLACGETGAGHLASQHIILQHAHRLLHPQAGLLRGRKILVTAGGTVEPIDPVRCISNHSSGKMGHALADEAWIMGADVLLLSSKPKPDAPYPVYAFQTARDLQALLAAEMPNCDWLLMAAAVSDFRPAEVAPQKIKKQALFNAPDAMLNIPLLQNADILAALGQQKQAQQKLIGFAAESQNLHDNAMQKIKSKNLDAIIANDISRSDIGFQSDDNEVTLMMADGESYRLEKAKKRQIAARLLALLQARFVAQECLMHKTSDALADM